MCVRQNSVEALGREWRRKAVLSVDLIFEWRGAGACLSALGCVEAGARR